MCIPLFQRYAINHFIEAGTLDGLSHMHVVYVCAILIQVTCGALVDAKLHEDGDVCGT